MTPVRLQGCRRAITVARDAAGVPHVSAESFDDALYGLGFMHAIDRRTQLLFMRAVAQGRACELIADSPAMLERDRFFRRAGLSRGLAEEFAKLPESERNSLLAYSAGVTDALPAAGKSLAMRAVGFRAEPWTPESIVLVGALLAYAGLALGQIRAERLILDLLRSGVDAALLADLHRPHLDGLDPSLYRDLHAKNTLADDALASLKGLPTFTASNAWAIAPRHSLSGRALLASDPHLDVAQLPAVWYEAALHWGDRYLIGATLPGAPMFTVARHNDVAWGVTYSMGDVSDWFVEEVRVSRGVAEYRRGNDWLPWTVRVESIERKRNSPDEHRVYTNPQGVLEGDPLADAKSGELAPRKHLLTAWTGFSGGLADSVATWLRVAHARSTSEAMDAIRACPQPPLCWVLADRDGRIGRQTSGRFPDRPPHASGLTILPAWDERNHWLGFVPGDDLPRDFDPPEGFIASANEELRRRSDGRPLTTLPDRPYRRRRIVELIEERIARGEKLAAADCRTFQYDVKSTQAADLLPVFLPALEGTWLHRVLADWDRRYDESSRAATIFTLLLQRVWLELLGRGPGGMGDRRVAYFYAHKVGTLVFHGPADGVLLRPDSPWWAGRDRNALIRRAAAKIAPYALEWGEHNAIDMDNQFVRGRLGELLRLHAKREPLAGCYATPRQGHVARRDGEHQTYAPSYHFVADLGDDFAWTNLPGGPSERGLSSFYVADLDRWRRGEYKRLAGRPR